MIKIWWLLISLYLTVKSYNLSICVCDADNAGVIVNPKGEMKGVFVIYILFLF